MNDCVPNLGCGPVGFKVCDPSHGGTHHQREVKANDQLVTLGIRLGRPNGGCEIYSSPRFVCS